MLRVCTREQCQKRVLGQINDLACLHFLSVVVMHDVVVGLETTVVEILSGVKELCSGMINVGFRVGESFIPGIDRFQGSCSE